LAHLGSVGVDARLYRRFRLDSGERTDPGFRNSAPCSFDYALLRRHDLNGRRHFLFVRLNARNER
jgi:hypothetical protein